MSHNFIKQVDGSKVCSWCGDERLVNAERECPRTQSAAAAQVPVPRVKEDRSEAISRALIVKFEENLLQDINLLKDALVTPLTVSIPFDRVIPQDASTGLAVTTVFASGDDGHEAVELVDAFVAFEGRCSTRGCNNATEEHTLTRATSVTGYLWVILAKYTEEMKGMLQYSYNSKDLTGATEGDGRPDEVVHCQEFMISKGEHKKSNPELHKAVEELTSKLTGYNHVEYGEKIVFLPVYAAAGELFEWGFVDVRNRSYHRVRRFDLSDRQQRASCFVVSVNVFRLLRTMAPNVPQNPTPLFKTDRKVIFFADHIRKKRQDTDTCPVALYNLLKEEAVPYAVRVMITGRNMDRYLRISPIGMRMPDKGQGLDVSFVREAVKCVLKCLVYLHNRGFVHRDIRWANLVRQLATGTNGNVYVEKVLVIDFEFAAASGTDITIRSYIFKDVVDYGCKFMAVHDLILVGMLVSTWANVNGIPLDPQATSFIQAMNSKSLSASQALLQPWLNVVL